MSAQSHCTVSSRPPPAAVRTGRSCGQSAGSSRRSSGSASAAGSLSSSLGSWGRQRRSTVRIGVPVLSRRPLPVSRSAVKDAVFPKSITATASRSPRRPWDAAARNSTVSTRYTPAADTSSVLLSTFV